MNSYRCSFYWGKEPLPLFNLMTLVTFRQLNPTYKMVLYIPKIDNTISPTWYSHEQTIPYTGIDYFEVAKSFVDEIVEFDFETIGMSNNMHNVHKSDILRHWLLYEFGGWWSDMDVIWLKPLHQLAIEDTYDLTVCLHREHHSNGIVYAAPKSFFYRNILTTALRAYNGAHYQCIGPALMNKLYPTVPSITRAHPNLRVKNFELKNFMYSLDVSLDMKFYEEFVEGTLDDDVYAVHWYGGFQDSGKFKNQFDITQVGVSNLFVYKTLESCVTDDLKELLSQIK